MLVMGLVGDVAAGKGTCIELLLKTMTDYKITVLRSSDILLKILNERSVEPIRENFNQLVEELQKNGGIGALSRLMRNLILEEKNADIVIWDGVRLWTDVAVLVNSFDEPMFVYITADCKIRHRRAVKRARPGEADISLAKFLHNETLPTNSQVKKIGAQAHFKINNSYGLPELQRQVKILAKKLQEKNLAIAR